MNKSESNGPLDGVRVADFTQLAQGPFATQIMADLGAEVVKIEPPTGEWQRYWALEDTFVEGESISFLAFNRGKKSVALDLKSPAGLEAALQIVESADVVVENFRPGVMERLGLGDDELFARKPDLIICSSSGYGQSGPYVTRPGQDLLIQALAGLPTLNGIKESPPTPVGLGVADLVAGLHITYSVLAALVQRANTGKGARIQVNLLNSLLALMCQEYTAFLHNGAVPDRDPIVPGSPHAGAPYGLYPTADGHVAIAMNDVAELCDTLGVAGYAENSSSNLSGEGSRALRTALVDGLAKMTTHHAVSELLARDLWAAPLQTFGEVVDDPQVAHNELIVELEHPTAGSYRTIGPPVQFDSGRRELVPPPLLGEHTSEVLAGIGWTAEQIASVGSEERTKP